jgi:putative membrane protein
MKTLGRLVIMVLINAAGLWTASQFIPGVRVSGDTKSLIVLGLILLILNVLIKPILKFFLGPFILLTLGILLLAINAGMLYLLDIISLNLTIESVKALLLATLVVSAFNMVGSTLTRGRDEIN